MNASDAEKPARGLTRRQAVKLAAAVGLAAAGGLTATSLWREQPEAEVFIAKAAGYSGQGLYIDTPCAVRDGTLVTAAGSAPVTFAIEMLTALYPGRAEALQGFKDLCAREFSA